MALIKCKDCGKEISSEAAACPHCGRKPPKKTSGCAMLVAGFFGLTIIISIIASQNASNDEVERKASLTPEQLAAENASREKEQRFSSARGACLITLKKSLNDPDSAKFGTTSSWYVEERADGTILVQPSARAKNAFGAYVQGTWDCVVRPDGANVRIISLKQIRP